MIVREGQAFYQVKRNCAQTNAGASKPASCVDSRPFIQPRTCNISVVSSNSHSLRTSNPPIGHVGANVKASIYHQTPLSEYKLGVTSRIPWESHTAVDGQDVDCHVSAPMASGGKCRYRRYPYLQPARGDAGSVLISMGAMWAPSHSTVRCNITNGSPTRRYQDMRS